MMKKVKQKLTLDRPAAYQIKVPGHLDESWANWDNNMIVSVENGENEHPSTVDQAALQGLLRRLYSMGLPLISIECVECD